MTNRVVRMACVATALCSVWICISCKSSSSTASAGGGASAGGQVLMLCYTTPTAQVVRLSAVFPIKTVSPTIMLEEPWAKDFRVSVGQTNGQEVGSSVTCDQVTSKDALKEKEDALQKQGHQVVETGWAYAGG